MIQAKTEVFYLGATDFAGSAILHALLASDSFPAEEIALTALVRQEKQATKLKEHYDNISTVIGTMEDTDLLKAQAAKADIVIQAGDVDNAASMDSLMAGLASKSVSGGGSKGTFIAVSGAGNTLDLANDVPGEVNPKVYDDKKDAAEIWNLPMERYHVAVERKMVAEGDAHGVKNIILAPPHIYSSGYGYGKKNSFTDVTVNAMLDYGKDFVLGKGTSRATWISTRDLAEAVGFVVKDVLDGSHNIGSGKEGYYFVHTGETSSREIIRIVSEQLKAKGLVRKDSPVVIDAEEASSLHSFGSLLWGSNMRSRGTRLREAGWKPKELDPEPLVLNHVSAVLRQRGKA